MPSKWNERNPPIAFLLTFRTFGTWYHGDLRGSVDRRSHHRYGTSKIRPSLRLQETEKAHQTGDSFLLTDAMRLVVRAAIRKVCEHRGYELLALNVRSNHVHVVVRFHGPPEKIVEAFKSYATRALRSSELVGSGQSLWSRHASTRYLWNESSVVAAKDYVLYHQGDEFPSFDEILGDAL